MPLVTNTAMAVLCYVYTKQAIKTFAPMFVERGLFGIDLCKSSGDKIAESLGVISATCFLVQVSAIHDLQVVANLTWLGVCEGGFITLEN